MFSKQKDEKKISEISTIIGKETTIEGSLHVDSSIRIDGKVLGEIKCSGDVTVGKDGYVEHSITSRNLFVAGKVKGTVFAENKIHIFESGSLEGSVEMNVIVIDENGQFQGECKMQGADVKRENIVEIKKASKAGE